MTIATRPEVEQALTAAGWTRDDGTLPTLSKGLAYWVVTNEDGTSVLGKNGWVARFAPDAPTVAIVAAALAVAGQPPERLAEVIRLHPTA